MAKVVGTVAGSTNKGALPGVAAAPIAATRVARETPVRQSANGIQFAEFGDTGLNAADLERMVQAVPASIAPALAANAYYFVPLALTDAASSAAGPSSAGSGPRGAHDETLISPAYTTELADLSICHRNVEIAAASGDLAAREGVFISARLLSDRFSLAFEFFINVGHAFVDATGVPTAFAELAWNQAIADVRGETSQDAWETRALALGGLEAPPSIPAPGETRARTDRRPGSSSRSDAANASSKPVRVDEKSKTEYFEAAFADAIAIYALSLAVDFDYSELREREYPLLAPHALAERLRLVAQLFPPNPGYEFSIRYRRRVLAR